MDRQCSQFVKAEDFVVAPESKDLLHQPTLHPRHSDAEE